MTPSRDEIDRLLSLLEAVEDGVSRMSDEEVQAELAEAGQRPGPSVGVPTNGSTVASVVRCSLHKLPGLRCSLSAGLQSWRQSENP